LRNFPYRIESVLKRTEHSGCSKQQDYYAEYGRDDSRSRDIGVPDYVLNNLGTLRTNQVLNLAAKLTRIQRTLETLREDPGGPER